MADKTASYAVRVDSNAASVGQQGAAGLQQLQGAISGSMQAVKDYSAALRALRGSSDEVKGARDQLKAKLDAEKQAISAGNLELLKQGTTYERLSSKLKQAANDNAKHTEEIKKAAGPVAELRERFETFKATMSSAEGVVGVFAGILGAVAVALGVVAGATIAATYALARWIVVAADAARNAMLLREAWTGSASNAVTLGHQLDVLAGKVATPKEKLNELSGAVVKALNNSRVSGQGIVDTFNAVAQASAAMGDEVGAKIREIIERSKNTGRVQIGLFELQGTGIKREDIAAQLAQRMNVSTQAALVALANGRVKIDDAAAAIRAAVEKRFGEINARKLLSLDAQLQKFHERLAALAANVKIEPLLEAFAELGKLFDQSTVSGDALRQLVEFFGNRIGPAAKGAVPFVKEFFERLELGAYKAVIALLKIRNAITTAFKDRQDMITAKDVLEAIKVLLDGMAATAILAFREIGTGVILAGKAFFLLKDAVAKVRGIIGGGWKDVGANIVDGLTGGLLTKISALRTSGKTLAEAIKQAFAGALEIQSPSKVFQRYGEQTTEGYTKGLSKGGGDVERATQAMAPTPPAAAAPAPRMAPINLTVHIHAGGNPEAARQLAQPQFLANLTKAIEDALVSAGLPVQAAPQP